MPRLDLQGVLHCCYLNYILGSEMLWLSGKWPWFIVGEPESKDWLARLRQPCS